MLLRSLSRVDRKAHARFLGGGARAIAFRYPAAGCQGDAAFAFDGVVGLWRFLSKSGGMVD